MSNATTDQIMKAYLNLDEDELLALRIYAGQRLFSSDYTEPLDLMHEALVRALEGRRNWPLSVNFGLFMALTMRSIVSNEAGRALHRPGSRLSLDALSTGSDALSVATPSVEEELIAFEEVAMARKVAERVKAALKDDELALKVLSGMLSGLSPREMCASFHMDAKAFDAARHRVLRRLKSPAATMH